MFEALRARGFEVETRSHAQAIITGDFPEVAEEIEAILLESQIPIEEIIGSGGGETKGTQRLRRALRDRGWKKHNFTVQRVIDGRALESQSHEVDHIREFSGWTVALEYRAPSIMTFGEEPTEVAKLIAEGEGEATKD